MSEILERIVKKKIDRDDILISVIIVIASIVIALATAMIQTLIYYNFIIWALLVAFDVIIIRRRSIEWEYTLVRGGLSVDKIIARSSRKRVCVIDFEECDSFGPYELFDETSTRIEKSIECVSSMNSAGVYFVVFVENSKRCVLFFEPSEDMMSALKKKYGERFVKTKSSY